MKVFAGPAELLRRDVLCRSRFLCDIMPWIRSRYIFFSLLLLLLLMCDSLNLSMHGFSALDYCNYYSLRLSVPSFDENFYTSVSP